MARRKGPQAKQAYSYIKSKILSFELPRSGNIRQCAGAGVKYEPFPGPGGHFYAEQRRID